MQALSPAERLPVEILDQVLSDQDSATIFKACRVSRRWCAVSQPKLMNCWPNRGILILPFVRTLLDRPDLAQAVRETSIDDYGWGSPDSPRQIPGPKLLSKMLEKADQFRPGEKDWQTKISVSGDDATLALALYLLPSLNTLTWSAPDGKIIHPWIMRFVREFTIERLPAGFAPFLPRLRTFRYEPWTTDSRLIADTVGHLLRLPTLREVSTRNLVGCSFAHDSAMTSVPSQRPITAKSLSIWRSALTPSSLRHFLPSFKALEELSWQYTDDGLNHSVLLVIWIEEALRSHKSSLRRLLLHVAEDPMWRSVYSVQPIRSFQDFPLLTSITISCDLLVGHVVLWHEPVKFRPLIEKLPAALEELIILDITKTVAQHLLDLANSFVAVLNSLREVRCPEWKQSKWVSRIEVAQLFKEGGVELTVYKPVPNNKVINL